VTVPLTDVSGSPDGGMLRFLTVPFPTALPVDAAGAEN
jgi:hypothetical protein